MVQEENNVNDGADEQMLGAEDEKLAEKRDEVKFIKGDHQNGDAKIDIGVVNGKVRKYILLSRTCTYLCYKKSIFCALTCALR